MRVEILDYGAGTETPQQRVFKGEPDQVRAQLLVAYPWLRHRAYTDLQHELQALGRVQNLFVEVET